MFDIIKVIMPPKYASSYSYVKTPIEQNKFYSVLDAWNKQTKQVWLAKVIHQQAVEQLSLQQHIEYNQQVLLAMKDQETVIYANQIFNKKGDLFIIQEKFQVKLSTYLQQKGKINGDQVEKIIKDVFKSLCDVYKEGYVHRNIRPQHIVLVQGDEESQSIWKLETFVLDNKQFPVDTPFTWKKQTASLQEQNQKQELGDELLDAQIVWNFGYLSLQLVAGNDFMKKKMVRDSDIQWMKIKELCSKAPNLYELIQKCFRFKFQNRILLKNFFDLNIFRDCNRQGYSEYFLTASNFFKTKTFSSIQGSMRSMKSLNMKSQMIKNNLSPSTNALASQPKIMTEITQSIEQEEDEFNLIRGNFLSGVVNYVNFIESNQIAKVQNENKSIVEFYFIKLSLLFLDKVSKSILASKIKSDAEGRLNTKSNIVKRIKSTDNRLLKQFEIDTKQNYTLPQLIPIFNKLCGYAYSRVKESCEKEEKVQKIKALAYFGFAGIIVNINDQREVNKTLVAKKGETCLQVFQKTSPQTSVKLSQELIAKYFKAS